MCDVFRRTSPGLLSCFRLSEVSDRRQNPAFLREAVISSSYVQCPRRLEDTLDGTSEAGLLVTEVTTWTKINVTEQKKKYFNYLDNIVPIGVNDILIKICFLGKRGHAKKSGTLATDVQS